MVPGRKFNIGGKEYEVPPLSLGQLRNGGSELLKKHDEMIASANFGVDLLDVRGQLVIMAMRRNFAPETVSDEELWNGLDMENIGEIFAAVIGMSGFAGEATPARGTTEGIGMTSDRSIPPSPPPTDGTSAS